jgi:hypothetical protein
VDFDFSDAERKSIYVDLIARSGRSRGNNVAAFMRATFDAWRNRARSGIQQVYVGYSPVVTVDADKILDDFPDAHVVHIARNPWSAYADTCRRPVPLGLAHYMLGWTLNQQAALLFRERYQRRMHILRIEDVLNDPRGTLGSLCISLGLDSDAALDAPSWNGQRLAEVYPWGTIRHATSEANRATANELSDALRDEIRQRAGPFLELLDYHHFL